MLIALERESQLAQTVVNAGAVKAQLETATANSAREAQQQQADHRQRLEASERVLGDMDGRLKSSTQLMVERGNAVIDQLSAMETRVQRQGVRLEELEGRSDALGSPVTRSETRQMVDDATEQAVNRALKKGRKG